MPDSAPIECAVDGLPCDDLNICTDTSTCTGGICVGRPPNWADIPDPNFTWAYLAW